MTQRQKTKLLKQLRKVIYAYHESGTQENSDIVECLKEECFKHCTRDVTNNTISEVFWVIQNE